MNEIEERRAVVLEGRLEDLRNSYIARIRDQIKTRRSAGYTDEQIEKLAESYRQEARDLFEDEDALKDALEAVDELVDDATESGLPGDLDE